MKKKIRLIITLLIVVLLFSTYVLYEKAIIVSTHGKIIVVDEKNSEKLRGYLDDALENNIKFELPK